MKTPKGFTLIELIMSVIIISICIIPVAVMFQQAMHGSVEAKVLTVANALAEEKMEEILRLGYANVTNQSGTFTGFSDYSFQVTVNYANSSDLNTPVANATGYRSVEVGVAHGGIQPVALRSLVTNY